MATCIAADMLLIMVLAFRLRHCISAYEHLSAHHPEERHSEPVRAFLPQWMADASLHHQRLIHQQDSSNHTPKQGQYHSQDAEDRAAELKYFHNLHSGVFLEMGALDGVRFSNTKYFEDDKDWRGILIEPNSVEFEKLSVNRPNAISVNAAVCARRQTVHFVGERLQESAGPVGGIWEFMSPAFRAQWYGNEKSVPQGAVIIPCMPLQEILQSFGVTHIDFFSLDVEGAELEVLQTLNFTAFQVSVLVVEQDGGNPGKDKAVRQLLAAKGFIMDKSLKGTKAGSRNDWFVNKLFVKSEAPKSSLNGLA